MNPADIELTTNRELRDGPFPYEDCHWLKQSKGADEDLIPDLDLYFSTIVGFGMSASRLELRSPEQLRKQLQNYRPYLGLSFFERHAKYRHLEPDINESNTPKLFRELVAANKIRIGLLPILDELLSREENRKVTR